MATNLTLPTDNANFVDRPAMEFISETVAYRIYPLGETALSIEWQHAQTDVAHAEVRKAFSALHEAALPEIQELVPAYNTLSLFASNSAGFSEEFHAQLKDILSNLATRVPLPGRKIAIPVCYDQDFGPDLNAASAFLGITMDELIERHCAVEYDVFMLGFVPGFPYLGWVDQSIALPRLTAPRAKVPAGSIGIAGRQTGIYPSEIPGGWQIIGRTPMPIFNPDADRAFLLQPGDKVTFFAISASDFYSGKFSVWPS